MEKIKYQVTATGTKIKEDAIKQDDTKFIYTVTLIKVNEFYSVLVTLDDESEKSLFFYKSGMTEEEAEKIYSFQVESLKI